MPNKAGLIAFKTTLKFKTKLVLPLLRLPSNSRQIKISEQSQSGKRGVPLSGVSLHGNAKRSFLKENNYSWSQKRIDIPLRWSFLGVHCTYI